MANAREILKILITPDTPEGNRGLHFVRLQNLAAGKIQSTIEERATANLYLGQIYANCRGNSMRKYTALPRHDLAEIYYAKASGLSTIAWINEAVVKYFALRIVSRYQDKSPNIDQRILDFRVTFLSKILTTDAQKAAPVAALYTLLQTQNPDAPENLSTEEKIIFWKAMSEYYAKIKFENEFNECLKFARESCANGILLPLCLSLSSTQNNDKSKILTDGNNVFVNLVKYSSVYDNKKPIELLKNTLEATNALSADKAALLWLNLASFFMYKNAPQYDDALQALQNARKNLPIEQKAVLIDLYIELSVLSQNIFKKTDCNDIKRGCINDVIDITDPIELANKALSMNSSEKFALAYAEIAARALHKKIFLASNNSDGRNKAKDLLEQLHEKHPQSTLLRTKYQDMTNKHYRRNYNPIHQQNRQQHDTSHSTPTNPAIIDGENRFQRKT